MRTSKQEARFNTDTIEDMETLEAEAMAVMIGGREQSTAKKRDSGDDEPNLGRPVYC